MSSGTPTDMKDVGLLPIRPDPEIPLNVSATQVERIKKTPYRPPIAGELEYRFSRNQLAFINFYCRGMSARAAMIKAGYSPNNDASFLLYKPKIYKEIQKRLRVYFETQQITTQEVLEGVDRIANSNILDYIDVTEDGSHKVNLTNITRDQGEAIQSLEFDAAGRTRIKLVDKIAAKTLQARLRGMLTDKVEVTGKDGAPLSIKDFDNIRRNTTININQINIGNQERHHIPDTIESIDTLVSDNARPALDTQQSQ